MPAAKITTRPFFEMSDRAAADKHFRNLTHFDRGLNACMDVDLLESVLQGKGVDDGAEHPHVVCGYAVESLCAGRKTSKDVAAADHDGDFRRPGRERP